MRQFIRWARRDTTQRIGRAGDWFALGERGVVYPNPPLTPAPGYFYVIVPGDIGTQQGYLQGSYGQFAKDPAGVVISTYRTQGGVGYLQGLAGEALDPASAGATLTVNMSSGQIYTGWVPDAGLAYWTLGGSQAVSLQALLQSNIGNALSFNAFQG